MDYRIIYLICFGWIFSQVVSGLLEDDRSPFGAHPPVARADYSGPTGTVSLNSSSAADAEDHDEEDDHEQDSEMPDQLQPLPVPHPGATLPYLTSQRHPSAASDQHYRQPYLGQYSSHAKNYTVKIDPAVQNANYTPTYSVPVQYRQQYAAPYQNKAPYSQSYTADGYRPYNAVAGFYVRPAAIAAQGSYSGDYSYKPDDLCTISETPVDKSVYCGLPDLKTLTGRRIDPEKVGGEWYSYRHSPVGPLMINHVLRVHIFGRGTELPATNFPGVGVWGVLSGFRSTSDVVCSDHFYVGFMTRRGTQVVEDYFPGRTRIEPTVYHTLYLDDRRGVWLNYECARHNALTGVCAVANLCVAVRDRPDLMSADEQIAVDAAINQALAPYCMHVGQLPKQIYTNLKGTCPLPKLPDWLDMKIRGIVSYNKKVDLS